MREFRAHGISVLASMIVGFPYQTPAIIEDEPTGLLALRPDLTQFLIYGPVPGTPFHDRVMREGLLHQELVDDPETFYRKGSGFSSLVKHPTMAPAEVEAEQRRCFSEDFARLGPSICRVLETWLLGHQTLSGSPSALLRAKARLLSENLRKAYPVFLAGKWLGPTPAVRRWIADLEARVHQAIGRPTPVERGQSVGALGLAAWTWVRLRLGIFQHPALVRHEFRATAARQSDAHAVPTRATAAQPG